MSDEGIVVALLRQKLRNLMQQRCDDCAPRVFGVLLVLSRQFLVVSPLCCELLDDVMRKPVLVGGQVHRIKILLQDRAYLPHLSLVNALTDTDPCFRYLAPASQEVGEFRVLGTNAFTAVFDGNTLFFDEQCRGIGDVDFAPSVWYCLIAALHIRHGGGAFCHLLQTQILLDVQRGIAVRLRHAGEGLLRSFDQCTNLIVALDIFRDEVKLVIDACDEL